MTEAAATPRDIPPPAAPSRAVWFAAVIIVAATFAAYANSFSGPFVFDDTSSIVSNPSIRNLWPPWEALSTPRLGVTVGGRPILNLSLAINYAFGGTSVRGYHLGNVLIHVTAALALFGLLRRTLLRVAPPIGSPPRAPFAAHATFLALTIALLWAVHPLQIESVTYIIQRAESLMGMFYLLTLYCFVRAIDTSDTPTASDTSTSTAAIPTGRRLWFAASIVSCLLGMGTKEVMVSAPVLVLLYDRTFVAGSFLAALRQRAAFYAGLAATWLYLGYLLIITGGNRGGSAGFDVGVSWWDYFLTQFPAIARYLRLSLWPHPLAFEYGSFWVDHVVDVLPAALLVTALVAATVWAFWRRPAWSFPAIFFFAILSVTSLVPGTTQMIVEHRMYLPLAAVLTGLVLGAHVWMGQGSRVLFFTAALACIFGTSLRNAAYRSELSLWRDTVAKRPNNALAHEMLALALAKSGSTTEAITEHEAALTLHPNFAVAHSSLADDLFRLGRVPEAITHYESALKLQSDYVDAHHGLAIALSRLRQFPAAIAHFNEVLRLRPDFPEAHFNLANTLAAAGQPTAALPHYEAALRQKPDYAEAANNLANTLVDAGRAPEALPYYEAALRAKPDYALAQYNFANALSGLGRRREAIAHYEAALRQKPDYFDARANLAATLLDEGRTPEAIASYEEALRLRPDADAIRQGLARLRAAR